MRRAFGVYFFGIGLPCLGLFVVDAVFRHTRYNVLLPLVTLSRYLNTKYSNSNKNESYETEAFTISLKMYYAKI